MTWGSNPDPKHDLPPGISISSETKTQRVASQIVAKVFGWSVILLCVGLVIWGNVAVWGAVIRRLPW